MMLSHQCFASIADAVPRFSEFSVGKKQIFQFPVFGCLANEEYKKKKKSQRTNCMRAEFSMQVHLEY